jgi:hypothetical protein
MSDLGSLIPISDEQAKAAQEIAMATNEALKALQGFGGFLKETLGTVPQDLVGVHKGRKRGCISEAAMIATYSHQRASRSSLFMTPLAVVRLGFCL